MKVTIEINQQFELATIVGVIENYADIIYQNSERTVSITDVYELIKLTRGVLEECDLEKDVTEKHQKATEELEKLTAEMKNWLPGSK